MYLREQCECNIRVTRPANDLYSARRRRQTTGHRSGKDTKSVYAHYVIMTLLIFSLVERAVKYLLNFYSFDITNLPTFFTITSLSLFAGLLNFAGFDWCKLVQIFQISQISNFLQAKI